MLKVYFPHAKIAATAFVMCLAVLCLAGKSFSEPPAAAPAADTMNGYSMAQFRDFEKNWHLVTTRFRKDTGEMRITYANDIAWAALQKHSADYPDGAVFAKIGLMTQDDPAFTSSAVPSGARRYQFMVRDHKKHAETRGWGYAIFTPAGKPTYKKEDQDVQSLACSACHDLVSDRGYVFSQPMILAVAKEGDVMPAAPAPALQVSFTTDDGATLPQAAQKNLPANTAKVRRVHGPFEKHVFPGTMGEIRPTLIKEAITARLPAVLADDASALFAIAYINPDKAECTAAGGKKGVSVITVSTAGQGTDNNHMIKKMEYCEAGY
ncbi:MAG: cytochrome P460 family protein [Micavibrio sp.]|nr:cytochrome P460 family protein [Micavibrio sp.]